ncbi:hypothetical protein GGF46_002803 [Coemansia sp. RSA 552]|nr:hypothetical protein GGF46_002803 [Coemansia sp. RSA 552]
MKEDQPESAQDQQETTQNQQENTRELSEKTDRDRASSEQPALPPRPRTSTQGYRLKDVEWRDTETGRVRDVKIVTQNENGPCPLIALANVLTLSGKLQLGPASRRTVTEAELTSMLADRLLSQDVGTPGASETDVSMILSLLPTMNTGLDVDLQFSHIYDFADTPPAQLFRVFGADLVHGWVVDMDQEADIAETLRSDCRSNYEGAVEFIFAADELSHGQVVGDGTPAAKIDEPAPSLSDKQQRNVHAAVALNRWLAANATQLTPAGLRFLGTQLPENHLCVLFRNNHFSTLYKRGVGELFILCTDDVVAGDTRIVWESLRDVHQATSQFLDSSFQPLGAATGQGGGSRENPDYAHQSREGRGPQGESAAQIDSDYAMALRLHEQEQERENQQRQQQQSGNSAGQLQVRQQDRLPPGMTQRGSLYGVPEVTPGGESRLARAMHRTRSDENFEQRMQNTWLPNEPKSPRTKKAQQDKCTIC